MEKHSTGKNTAALGDAELLYNEYWMSDETYERFHEFKGTVLGIEDEKTPSERSAFYKRTRLVIITACFIFYAHIRKKEELMRHAETSL